MEKQCKLNNQRFASLCVFYNRAFAHTKYPNAIASNYILAWQTQQGCHDLLREQGALHNQWHWAAGSTKIQTWGIQEKKLTGKKAMTDTSGMCLCVCLVFNLWLTVENFFFFGIQYWSFICEQSTKSVYHFRDFEHDVGIILARRAVHTPTKRKRILQPVATFLEIWIKAGQQKWRSTLNEDKRLFYKLIYSVQMLSDNFWLHILWSQS